MARLPIAAVLCGLLLVAVGCRESPDGPAPSKAADVAPAFPADDTPVDAAPDAPAPARRHLALARLGWQFALDAAETPGRTRIDVLVRPATVGAAPTRRRIDLDGRLSDAFATDLDGDAQPELLLWWETEGSSAEGTVAGWRWRPDGGIDDLVLPALDTDLATGWRGRDQFGIQGGRLVRSFPLYRDGDDNAHPDAGFLRVVVYRLDADGFVVDATSLEPVDGTPQAELLAR